ncbi:hypothetical protein BDK51DRAFT_25956 [Blyttiomyces helicus]|uniref:F-box domain-containing protein n=1 Tax=Blyttiomyces helicus TaxID=388810 RepID=A0A4V1IRQ1_9FUNG|nr:hypothetical protein BDK51DRAFT_25956 [Blyttiomyces helicus]|eukprot:RKO90837.1 hypothetical protein BDK51DRAFT_25956 [Blyttiomyces helicus]
MSVQMAPPHDRSLSNTLPPETHFRILRFLHPLKDTQRQRTLIACTLVYRSWGSVAFHELWENSVVTSKALILFERLSDRRGRIGSDRVERKERQFVAKVIKDREGTPVSRATGIGPRTVGLQNFGKFRGAWSLPDVARVFINCPKRAVFGLIFPVDIPASLDDFPGSAYAAKTAFWASPVGLPLWNGLRRLRALKLLLPSDFNIAGALERHLIQWTAAMHSTSSRNREVAMALPHIEIFPGACIEDDSLVAYAVYCPQLVKVDLITSNVTDAGVNELLSRCSRIEELDLTDTPITATTMIALKSHRPLTLLAMGYNKYLFAGHNHDADVIDFLQVVNLGICRLKPLPTRAPVQLRVGCAKPM